MRFHRSAVKAFLAWLIRPSPSLQPADRRRQSQLLAILLLMVAPIGLIVSLFTTNPLVRERIGAPELVGALTLGLFAIIPYLINRRGHVEQAARLTVYVSAAIIYVVALHPDNPQGMDSLLRLLLPILVASLFFTTKEQLFLVALVLMAALVAPLLAPHLVVADSLIGPFSFLLIASILVVLLSVSRRQLEKDRQSELRAQEMRHGQLLDAAFDAILTHQDGRLSDVSGGFEPLFGHSSVDGLNLDDFITEELLAENDTGARRCEAKMRRKDGSEFYAELITIDRAHGTHPVSITAVRDVSRARRVEQALRESERRFRLLTESSPDFVYIWEAGADHVPYFNRDGFLGYTHEELAVPGYLASQTHPDDWMNLQAHWQSVYQNQPAEATQPVEYRIRHMQGHWEWLERWDVVLMQRPGAKPDQILVTLRVITTRKKAEDELRASEAYNRALLDAIPDWIIHVDPKGHFTGVWPSKMPLATVAHSKPGDLVGRNINNFLLGDAAEQATQAIQLALDTGEVQVREYRYGPSVEPGRFFEARWVAHKPNEVIAIVRDVTQRKAQEDRLRREASIYQHVVEAIIVMDVSNDEYRIRGMNPAAQKLYGWQEDEVVGRLFIDVFRPQYGEGLTREHVIDALSSAGHWSGEIIHLHRDGTPLRVHSSVTMLHDSNGDPTGAVAVILDVTRWVQAETALRTSEERLQTALKGSPVVVSDQDRELRYTWIHNPALDFDPNTILGKRDAEVLERPEDAERVESLKRQVLESGVGLRRAVQWQQRGETRYYDLTIEPLHDVSGEVIGITCAQFDMTERVREEEARQKVQHLLQTVIANVPIVIWAVDREGMVTLAEGRSLGALGLEAGMVVGKSIYEVLPQTPPLLSELQRALNGEAVTSFVEIGQTHYQIYYRPVFDASGQPDGLVIATMDISERMRAERQELHLALEHERINMLQRFMGDVSHDFRTPLTSIKLSLYLLTHSEEDARRQRHIQVIEMQTTRLEKLVTDLFTMSRLDQSITGEFNFGIIDINALVDDVVISHEPLIHAKDHTVRFERGEGVPSTFGDSFQLDRALTNLLVNAINYTPDGGQIVVRTGFRLGDILIEIEDNGIGIPADQHERIFSRFFRGDPARNVDRGGMGVGLSIVRKVIEAHGGRVEVVSAPGEGSTFRVLLPQLQAR